MLPEQSWESQTGKPLGLDELLDLGCLLGKNRTGDTEPTQP